MRTIPHWWTVSRGLIRTTVELWAKKSSEMLWRIWGLGLARLSLIYCLLNLTKMAAINLPTRSSSRKWEGQELFRDLKMMRLCSSFLERSNSQSLASGELSRSSIEMVQKRSRKAKCCLRSSKLALRQLPKQSTHCSNYVTLMVTTKSPAHNLSVFIGIWLNNLNLRRNSSTLRKLTGNWHLCSSWRKCLWDSRAVWLRHSRSLMMMVTRFWRWLNWLSL